ncbi:DUF2029 domain-containing protein [Acidisoma cellulosilytica]|uniref:DUF2029 domain-containing protein n=1 Tax=Acidisoma cellulosilyticum TaxID=2802395 RepID=A0A963Z5W9_9PROT|nr:glycosyltransferase family 87 protein [Acidisoma cellulosilyticum]MCB8882413.1 DUF2029 domain-containing protein [Acidisoma cellulosilyticum]
MNGLKKDAVSSFFLYSLFFLLSSLAVLSLASIVIAILELKVSDPTTLFWDFRNAYYPAGVAVLDGVSLSPLIHKGVLGFVNLPVLAWIFAPFALLPVKVAASIFTLIGACAIALAFFLLAELAALGKLGRAWLLLVMAANGPMIYSLKLGNTSHIILAMLAGGLWLLRRKRSLLAGLLLGMAALIKLPLLLVGLYFVFRRDRFAALGFFGLVALLTGLSIALFGLKLHLQWCQDAIGAFNGHALEAFNVQSLQSFLLRLRDPAPALNDWKLYAVTPQIKGIALCLTLVFYAVFIWTCTRPNRPAAPDLAYAKQDRDYMALIALCLISSPLTWTHYYCWLLLPAAFAIKALTEGPRRPWLSILAILLISPPVTLLHSPVAAWSGLYDKLLVSTYLFGGVIWFLSLALTRHRQPALAAEREFPIASPLGK